MIFDPESMKWIGNDNEVDIFEDIDVSVEKNGFRVGSEFSLSQELISSFNECEKQHKQLKGWFSQEENDSTNSKSNLFTIRNVMFF